MKRQKNHNFKHLDPEKKINNKSTAESPKKNKTTETVPESLKLDMKRTLTLVLLFLIVLTIFFVIQNKTGQPKDFLFRIFQ